MFVGRRHMLDSDEARAEALLKQMNLEAHAGIGEPGRVESVGVFRRLRWASLGAAEAVRILEIHQRAGRLPPEGVEALERYRRFHEAAELVLVGHPSYPWDPATTLPRTDFWDRSEIG